MQAEVISEYREQFRNFQRSAFRLEALPQYLVDSDTELFAQFKAGELLRPPRVGVSADWVRLIQTNIAAGKTMQRVHVLPESLTPYLRFEIEWGYVYTATAGEDIRILLPTVLADERLHARKDFWLFDDETIFFMNYEADGRFVGVEKSTDTSEVQRCCDVRDLLLRHAITLQEYLKIVRNS